MRKQNDAVQQFTTLRSALLREREAIQQRLRLIDAALAGSRELPAAKLKTPGRRRGARPENAMNIRDAIARVTAKKALSIREIVEAVQKIGYRFQSANPVNSVGAYLYGSGKKDFKRTDGKFSPVR
jgi:hypothetical protein